MVQKRIVFLLSFVIAVTACGPQATKPVPKKKQESVSAPNPIFYPQTKGPFPAILLVPQAVHNLAGEYEIGRKLAAEGYVARAVDYGDRKFSGIFGDPSRMNNFKQLADESLASLKAQPGVDPDRIGIIGYSLGGYFVTYLASRPGGAGLRAGVVYYGMYDVPEHVKNLRIPVLAFQGDADHMSEFIRNAIVMRRLAMDAGKELDLVFFPRGRHGFDRVQNGPYERENAKNSWIRMIRFMNEHVKGAHP